MRSTAGEDDSTILRYRTEPVRLVVDVDEVFEDFGLYELYDQDVEEMLRRVAGAEDALLDATCSARERAQLAEYRAGATDLTTTEDPAEQARKLAALDAARSLTETLIARAEEARGPLVEAWTAAVAGLEAVEALWEQDRAAYRQAYVTAARQALTARGVAVDVEVVDPAGAEVDVWDALADELHEHARTTAPLPMTGRSPEWAGGTPADALRSAALTYIDRAASLGRA